MGLNPSNIDSAAADMSGDGVIDIEGGLLIAQYYVGFINELPGCDGTPEPTSTPTATPKPDDPVGPEGYIYRTREVNLLHLICI
jgi:hypothetical protein